MFIPNKLPSLSLSKDQRRFALLAAMVIALLCVFTLSRLYVQPLRAFSNKGLATYRDVQSICLAASPDPDIEHLAEILRTLAACRTFEARRAVELIDRLFFINRRTGKVILPAPFQSKVRGWLGNNEELFEEVAEQTITSIFNRITYEEAIFNPLRGKRPGANAGADVVKYVNNLVNETAASCDFCKYSSFTARDDFGRVESKYAITASNTFKYDGLHALIMFRHHDPRTWTQEQFLDLMSVMLQWFEKAHDSNPRAQYPHVMWDMLPKASASQLHPHAQASLAPQRYYGLIENLRLAMKEYDLDYPHENYFVHLVEVHDVLGLAYHYGNATAIAYLTPKKESEVFIIAPTPCEDFFVLLHHVLRVFIEEWEFYAWSMGMSLPPYGIPTSTMPAIARVIDRGNPTSVRSDISALELFAASNVNADPFVLMKKLRPSLDRRIHLASATNGAGDL
eukprot:m.95341 g.95341  ORF g.95341 m.95341 type:complete len:453 (+) comp15445_c0_seq1:230-1588(+)